MRKLAYALMAALLTATALALAAASGPGEGRASSHREAPLIAEDPVADNTDLYAFVSPDRPDTRHDHRQLHPAGGAGGRPELLQLRRRRPLRDQRRQRRRRARRTSTYQFRFKTKITNPNTFLYNTGPITRSTIPTGTCARPTRVTRIAERRQHGRVTVSARICRRRPPTSAPARRPNYEALAAAAVHDAAAAGSRSSPASATTRSSSTSARCSTWRPASVQPAAPDSAAGGRRRRRRRRLQHPLDRDPGSDRAADQRPKSQPTIGIYASASRQRVQRAARRRRQERQRQLGAGLAARQPADQRGHDPARPQGPLERVRSRRTTRSSCRSTRARSCAARERALRRLLAPTPPTGPRTTWSRSC